MSKSKRDQLVQQALTLTALGAQVERERERLKELVERGVSYSAPEMLAALARFQEVDAEWKRLEMEHLALRARLRIR